MPKCTKCQQECSTYGDDAITAESVCCDAPVTWEESDILFAPSKICKICGAVNDGKHSQACVMQRLNFAIMSEGRKDDNEKIRMDLLPFESLEEVAKVLTFSTTKHKENDWKDIQNADNYFTGKIMRHLTAHRTGKKIDGESGLLHAAHMATNALFLLWFEIQKEKENENRERNI